MSACIRDSLLSWFFAKTVVARLNKSCKLYKLNRTLTNDCSALKAVAQQQKDLKEQIKHLDEKVKEAAPDEARLAQLRKTVAQNEKRKLKSRLY